MMDFDDSPAAPNQTVASAPHLLPGHTPSSILCCLCATPIVPNDANMCHGCLATKVDISEGIPKELVIHRCQGCERYLRQAGQYALVRPESKELMALLLRNVRGLKGVRLVDANFIWTEPHSKRLKIQLKIQKEQFTKLVLQQEFVVEFTVANQFCDDCHLTAAGLTWQAVVQVRQKVSHKKTFLYLEQLILKHNAHDSTLSIKPLPDGIDFFFAQRNKAIKFIEFVSSVMAVRHKVAKQLVSADLKNADYNYKFNYMVEIVPICKFDIMALPKVLASNVGQISPLVLCERVATAVCVVDPLSGQTAEFDEVKYWKSPFRPFASAAQLVDCTVLNVEPVDEPVKGHFAQDRRKVKVHKRRSTNAGTAAGSSRASKFNMVWVELASTSELGVTTPVTVKSHLGHLLAPGDSVLAYDLKHMVYNDADVASLAGKRGGAPNQMPDFIIVRKFYPARRAKMDARRLFQLQALRDNAVVTMETDDVVLKGERKKRGPKLVRNAKRQADALAREGRDFNSFLVDLEEDQELRSRINLYKDHKKISQVMAAKVRTADEAGDEDSDFDDDGDFPEIDMSELLESMENMTARDRVEEARRANGLDGEEDEEDAVAFGASLDHVATLHPQEAIAGGKGSTSVIR